MQKFADQTGGTAFLPKRSEDLTSIFRSISSELRAQYLLQYYSNNESAGNKFLRIKVTAPGKTGFRIRAREGYYPKRK